MSEDISLSFAEIITTCHCEPEWLLSLIEESALKIEGNPQQARYTGYHLTLLRRSLRIRRDFTASAPATALILELLDELNSLRKHTGDTPAA